MLEGSVGVLRGADGDNGQASNQVGRDCGGQLSFLPFLIRAVDQETSNAKAGFCNCEPKSFSSSGHKRGILYVEYW